MELTASNVEAVLVDCLFREDEVVDLAGATEAAGIVNRYAFHPQRLESHREDVHSMLHQLPDEFINGGGWTFLNMCMRADGEQWTGLHRTQEHLACMAIALGLGAWVPEQRELWEVFPGSVPYFGVTKDDH